MNRYQVYLNQHSVKVIDEFAEKSDFSRSKLIRKAVDKLSHNLSKILAKSDKRITYNSLDDLVGAIKLLDKGQTNYAAKNDRDYL